MIIISNNQVRKYLLLLSVVNRTLKRNVMELLRLVFRVYLR